MPHRCRDCKQTFESSLELSLHIDVCTDGQLFCDCCGERFAERVATEDGWHYRCPTEGCSGSGIDEDIHDVSKARILSQ